MEILNWQRGYGKTFRAIQEAKQRKLPLIVTLERQKRYIQEKDKDVEVYTVKEWQNKDDDRNVIIDELPIVLSQLGLRTELATMTSTSLGMYDEILHELRWKKKEEEKTNKS